MSRILARRRGLNVTVVVIMRRIERAPVRIPAHAVVDGELSCSMRQVSPNHTAHGRPRDVDGPVAEVLVEALHGRVEAGRRPSATGRPRRRREAALEVGRDAS